MGTRFGTHYSQFPGLWPRSSLSCQAQISHPAAHSVSQSPVQSPETSGAHGSPLLLCLGTQWETSRMLGSPLLLYLGAQCETHRAHCSARLLFRVRSWSIPRGPPATAGEFLTKQLPAVFKKCMAFHTAPLFNQSWDYPSQGLTRPNSSLFQV